MQEVLNDEADDIKEELGLCFSVSTNESQVRVEMNGVVVVVAVVVCLSRAASTACGGSQARGPISAIVTRLYHSHSNAGSLTH